MNYENIGKYIQTKRKEIFNSLIDNKKSFVILLAVPTCGSKDYSVVLGTKEILDKNKIPYIYILTSEEPTFDESKLYYKGFRSGSVVITNKGEIGAYSDPDIYSFKNNDETKVWLNKYITVK